MFFTFKGRLLLAVYIFLILSIPVGSYLSSQYQNTKSKASEEKPKATVKPTSRTATSSAKLQLLKASENNLDAQTPGSTSSPEPSSPTIANSFGPTLSLKTILEGRPAENQATKLFVGIMEGILSNNPRFLLSFTVDLPESGTYSDLSLAGLSPGTTYTALLRGTAQIATSSAFTVSPTVTNLNEGQPLFQLTGDLNEDNVINSSDYSILQKAFGSNSQSENWNELADFNKDGVINVFDLSIISRNLNKIGASGTWTSTIPKAATSSGAINPQGSQGYWIWVPGF